MCDMARFLGLPRTFDCVFSELSGSLHRRKRLFQLSPLATRLSIEESVWQCRVPRGSWKTAVIRIDDDWPSSLETEVFKHKGYRLFADTPAVLDEKEFNTAIRTFPEHPLPPVVVDILRQGAGQLVLGGGAALSWVGRWCGRPSDYDFFIYGVTPNDAEHLISQISDTHELSHEYTSRFTSTWSVFDTDTGGFIRLQFITKIFIDPAEVLHFFDMNACKVAVLADKTNGELQTWATPTWVECMKTRIIFFDDCIWSNDLPTRLLRYYCKGFDIVLPAETRLLEPEADLSGPIRNFEGKSQILALEFQFRAAQRTKREDNSQLESFRCWLGPDLRLQLLNGRKNTPMVEQRHHWADIVEFLEGIGLYQDCGYSDFDFNLKDFGPRVDESCVEEAGWTPAPNSDPDETRGRRWSRRIMADPRM